jgi:hypothetical protein
VEVTGLAGTSWTQQAEETQGLVEGFVRATNPGLHACAVHIALYLDGREVEGEEPLIQAGQTTTARLPWTQAAKITNPAGGVLAVSWLPETGEPQTHQVQAITYLGCSPNPEPVVLEELRVAVIGVK